MPCFNPIAISNRAKGYGSSKAVVPCGKCLGCLATRRNAWTFRLLEQERQSTSSTFLTLTYDDENLPLLNSETGEILYQSQISETQYQNEAYNLRATLDKADLQKYFKKLRRHTNKLKYYAVGEYGEKNGRPHYHAIVFNADKKLLTGKWDKGRSQADQVTQASIHYVTKYMINSRNKGYREKTKPFAAMSKGIGLDYVKNNWKYHYENMDNLVVFQGGQKQIMPRYIKDKIFSEDEKIELKKKTDKLIEENPITYAQHHQKVKYLKAREHKLKKSDVV